MVAKYLHCCFVFIVVFFKSTVKDLTRALFWRTESTNLRKTSLARHAWHAWSWFWSFNLKCSNQYVWIVLQYSWHWAPNTQHRLIPGNINIIYFDKWNLTNIMFHYLFYSRYGESCLRSFHHWSTGGSCIAGCLKIKSFKSDALQLALVVALAGEMRIWWTADFTNFFGVCHQDSWILTATWLEQGRSWVRSTVDSAFSLDCLCFPVSRTSTWYSSSPPYLHLLQGIYNRKQKVNKRAVRLFVVNYIET